MIEQTTTGLNSRGEANPFDKEGMLHLITAPIYSVVDETNYQIFLDNKIQVCLPRNINLTIDNSRRDDVFYSGSLEDFIKTYIDDPRPVEYIKVCIDTANGNMPALHEAIRKAKGIHGDRLIIMAGNVGSVGAFTELAKTGVDYIRVGIGGGGGCNTTSNTGVGQENLEYLIEQCNQVRLKYKGAINTDSGFRRAKDWLNIANVKIVADGISSYVKWCEREYGFNDNGYAAINKLLYVGADLVMIGKLFAQCVESAGKKEPLKELRFTKVDSSNPNIFYSDSSMFVRYSGMSTQGEQLKYKEGLVGIDFTMEDGTNKRILGGNIKPSEGSVQWIPVRWTLEEWLHGSENQDQYPYLMGWINSIRSMMSYTGLKTLKDA